MSLSATRKPRAVTGAYLARRLRAAARGLGRLPAAFRRAFGGSVSVCRKARATQRRSAGSSAESAPVTATQPVMRRPGMGSKAVAPGCFWGVEEAFRHLDGVASTAVGYSGGHLPNPTYHDVCSGGTGHAECVQVEYDPARVSYEQLLDVFWENHDPTQLNRQGPDVGT